MYPQGSFYWFVSTSFDRILGANNLFAVACPPIFSERENRLKLGKMHAKFICWEFEQNTVPNVRLVFCEAPGYDLLYTYTDPITSIQSSARISLKSMQTQEVFQRPQHNSTGKDTTPGEIMLSNRLGKGSGELDPNFDYLLMCQHTEKGSVRHGRFTYAGIGCASFAKVQKFSYATNDQIKVKMSNVDWDFCQLAKPVQVMPNEGVKEDPRNSIAREYEEMMFRDLYEYGKKQLHINK